MAANFLPKRDGRAEVIADLLGLDKNQILDGSLSLEGGDGTIKVVWDGIMVVKDPELIGKIKGVLTGAGTQVVNDPYPVLANPDTLTDDQLSDYIAELDDIRRRRAPLPAHLKDIDVINAHARAVKILAERRGP